MKREWPVEYAMLSAVHTLFARDAAKGIVDGMKNGKLWRLRFGIVAGMKEIKLPNHLGDNEEALNLLLSAIDASRRVRWSRVVPATSI